MRDAESAACRLHAQSDNWYCSLGQEVLVVSVRRLRNTELSRKLLSSSKVVGKYWAAKTDKEDFCSIFASHDNFPAPFATEAGKS